jgi:hypothetical protein
MKKYLILALCLFVTSTSLFSQEQNDKQDEKVKTLFGSTEFKSSGYGGPMVKFTSINGEFGLLCGARGAWTINRTFSIGLAGYGLTTRQDVDYTLPGANGATKNKGSINLGYGGIYFEYLHHSIDAVHLAGNVLIGAGGVDYTDRQTWIDEKNTDYDKSAEKKPWEVRLFVEPTVAVEFNITSYFRLSAEIGYRWSTKIRDNSLYRSAKELHDINFNALSGGLTFEFGCF